MLVVGTQLRGPEWCGGCGKVLNSKGIASICSQGEQCGFAACFNCLKIAIERNKEDSGSVKEQAADI